MPASMQQWVALLGRAPLPVLARTVSELAHLRDNEDKVTTRHIANVVLHDPFMTVKVLQYLQEHRSKRQSTEITTIAHALMMLGLTPFFEHFGAEQTIEQKLAGDPRALKGALTVMSRGRLAALYAGDWARIRNDVDPEEVMVAALLHDLAEMMLWCFAPALALEIAHAQRRDPTLRSEAAQTAVLGFSLVDLQLGLVKAWHLPELLHVLMDDHHVNNPRVLNVVQAAAVARHSARSWSDPALANDYAVVGRLLHLSATTVEGRVIDVAQAAAHEWEWYGIPVALPNLVSEHTPGNTI